MVVLDAAVREGQHAGEAVAVAVAERESRPGKLGAMREQACVDLATAASCRCCLRRFFDRLLAAAALLLLGLPRAVPWIGEAVFALTGCRRSWTRAP